LFFNTPVRRKFMRTPQTEMGHATEAMIRIALAYPQVRFALHSGQRTTLDLPPVTDLRDRISSCFGSELASDLIWVESEDQGARIYGYVGNPKHSRSTNKHQYLFLNGRHIRDRALQHALSEAYRGILLTGRHPITFLNLEILPETVDVNVHPTKLEVRFQDAGRLYKQLLGMLRNRFLTTDLTATFRPETAEPQDRLDPTHTPANPFQGTAEFKPFPDDARRRDEIVSWARGQQSTATDFSLRAPVVETQQSLALSPADAPAARPASTPAATELVEQVHTPAGGSSRAMQVHNRYLVTASDDGIVVIDQHALHERVIYEQLREKVLRKQVEKQRLLVPEPVQLTPTEAAAVLQSQQLLSDLGIDVEDFGGETILVSSYPAMLANFAPAELIRQLAEQLSTGTKLPDSRDLLDEILHMISCKAAVKAGDRLAPEEIESLIEQRHLVQDSHHCPHGRPTTLVFTQKELDKRFQRT
jgi:DNA mismatch repair protein MutL